MEKVKKLLHDHVKSLAPDASPAQIEMLDLLIDLVESQALIEYLKTQV